MRHVQLTSKAGLIIREDAKEVGEYIAKYIAKRYVCKSRTLNASRPMFDVNMELTTPLLGSTISHPQRRSRSCSGSLLDRRPYRRTSTSSSLSRRASSRESSRALNLPVRDPRAYEHTHLASSMSSPSTWTSTSGSQRTTPSRTTPSCSASSSHMVRAASSNRNTES